MKRLLKAFGYAFQGLAIFFKDERNALYHCIVSVLAILVGFYFNINRMEWIAILFAIALVFTAEIINSSIEHLADTLHPEHSIGIKHTKDIAAAAVLFSVIISVIIGIVIFFPYAVEILA